MLGLAIIGLGAAAAPHIEALDMLRDEISVRWICVRRPEQAEAAAARLGAQVTGDLASLWSDDGVDAVLILTPPDSHAALAAEAYRNGRHVLSEKPLAARLPEAEAMVDGAQQAGVLLGTVLQHRMRPGSQRLAELLAEGALGRIEAADLEVPWWRPQDYYDAPGRGTVARDGGGVLLTQAIHAIDLYCYLLGTPTVTAAHIRRTALHRMETEDHVAALLSLPSGGVGTLTASTATYPGHAERLRVVGTEGGADISGGTLTVNWLDGRSEKVAGETRTGSGAAIMDFSPEAHRGILSDFAAAVRDGRDPAAPGSAALATQRFIAAILAADPTWPAAAG